MRLFPAALLLVVIFPPAVAADDKVPAPNIDHPLRLCTDSSTKDTKGAPCAAAPIAVWNPPPEYSKKARKEKLQGTVILWIVIDSEGKVARVRVARSLESSLDEKAVEAVRLWRFKPGTYEGKPVAVQVLVEVNFRLQ